MNRSAFPECRNYEQLRYELKKLPMTWYPDLIRALVEAAYEKNVFVPNHASVFVQLIEAQLTKKQPVCHNDTEAGASFK